MNDFAKMIERISPTNCIMQLMHVFDDNNLLAIILVSLIKLFLINACIHT